MLQLVASWYPAWSTVVSSEVAARKVARSKGARWQGARWQQARWEGSDNRPQVVHIVVLGTDL